MADVVAQMALATRSNFSVLWLTHGLVGLIKLRNSKVLHHELSHCQGRQIWF
jgi:hypothetical protein